MSLADKYARQKAEQAMSKSIVLDRAKKKHIFQHRTFLLWEAKDAADYTLLMNRRGLGQVAIIRRDLNDSPTNNNKRVFVEWFEIERYLDDNS